MIALTLQYNRISVDLLPFCESLVLVDRRTGKSELTLTLCNADGRFSSAWAAVSGDSVSVSYGAAVPDAYSIENIAFNVSPRVCVWKCTARPATSKAPASRGAGSPPPVRGALVEARETRPTIPSIHFSTLVAETCKRFGVSYSYMPKGDPVLHGVAQYRESGYALIARYCARYGFGLRSTAEKIIVLPPVSSAGEAPAASISLSTTDVVTLSNADAIAPARVVASRFSPRSGTVETSRAGAGDGAVIAVDGGIDDAAGLYDAIVSKKSASSMEIVPNDRIFAGSVISYEGMTLEVQELTYTRTGDAESMTIKTRAAK